ncbi:CRISPR type III-A/MTUBE-associated protein Csm6 [Peptoniphilus harei]|uniref:type III-A CRISPR-associated CARF protein Csm6 n=1 Tax=Peptoniphilus harei TaxID=54005 RepID=UPI000F6E032F|nr:hypothetical protein [Peptoniphilus harei]QQE47560.1 hypothetical protein I6H69_03630 [Peptoniphilus harei]VEJ33870.1 CRISPR type III-A/MTUBE-associated protein Csm6 [Peptoniphilus harei]
MKILFSPIGMTDPISQRNLNEGSLLNICRFYEPDKIYLYMSKEVMEFHEKDDRYIKCLERVYKYLGKNFEYEIIDRSELEEVQIFDFFYKEYRDILYKIHEENPGAEILLNVSSGTPAMKSALFVLCALFNFPMTPVQVSTPEKKSNSESEENPLDDFLGLIDEIMTEPEVYGNRTEIAIKENLNFELSKDIIKNHLKKYNYSAAFEVAQMTREFLSEKSYYLIAAAFYRINLNRDGVEKNLKVVSDNFDYYETAQLKLVEYVLYLSVNVKRNMLLEFIRGISPVLDSLFKKAFELETRIDLDNYLTSKKGKVSWNRKKLLSDDTGKKILDVLNSSYNGFKFINTASSDNFLKLMESKEFGISERNITKRAEELRDIEREGRNKAAHQIVSIDDDFLKRETGYTSYEILNKVTAFVEDIKLGVKKEHWDSYEIMNEKIIESLK